jgi:hypothetical protein
MRSVYRSGGRTQDSGVTLRKVNMRRIICLAAFAVFALTAPATVTAGTLPRAFRRSPYRLELRQNGKAVTIAAHQATLKAAPFELVLTLPRKAGVLLNVSLTPTIFKRAAAAKRLTKGMPLGSGSGMAEHPRNPKRELWSSSTGSHYLYYKSAKEHRFSRVRVSGDRLIGARRVESVVDIHGTKKRLRIANLKGRSLYLVALRTRYTPAGSQEIWRDFLRLSFH